MFHLKHAFVILLFLFVSIYGVAFAEGVFLYLEAIGLNTLTSNNAFSAEHQNHLAEISNRAFSCLLAVLVSNLFSCLSVKMFSWDSVAVVQSEHRCKFHLVG